MLNEIITVYAIIDDLLKAIAHAVARSTTVNLSSAIA
jgi:hypothetical protein